MVSFPARHPTPRASAARKILHAVLSSRIAGSERYCADLANRQAALGHDVHVAGTRRSGIASLLDPRVTFHPVGRFFRGYQLRRLVAALRPEVCHGHLSAACKALARTAGSHATVATLHVGYKAHQHERLDGVICVNAVQTSQLGDYRGIVRTIPNWVPAAPEKVASSLRRQLGLRRDQFVVGGVGRLHPSKGVDLLIAAFRATAPADAALVLLGDGPQRGELERLAAGDARIHFLGHRSDVHECLQDCDLFVSPSREESFGLAIIEAMSLGLPVIATATNGPAEYLRAHPVSLVSLNDAPELAAAIADASCQFQRGSLGRRQYDLSAFDPNLRVGHVMDFYDHLLTARQRIRVHRWLPVSLAT